MAAGVTRVLLQPCTAQTINSAATYTSAEQDVDADTILEHIHQYLEVDGFAAAPAGNEQMITSVSGVHTTAGALFNDQPVSQVFTVVADQQYQFEIPLCSLSEFFKQEITNDTAQNTDANAVDSWIEVKKATLA